MPYKKGDTVEIKRRGSHGFEPGTVVTVTEVIPVTDEGAYKVDHDVEGKKRSRYVGKKDLVKRRQKK